MLKIITGVIIEESQALTLEEFCHATQTQKELVLQMIDYQLISPAGDTPEQWRFDSHSLKRGRIAASFYQDLEVNLPGVALALELLDKITDLQQQIAILEKK
jgi:chaperone modulatory protein CbpM